MTGEATRRVLWVVVVLAGWITAFMVCLDAPRVWLAIGLLATAKWVIVAFVRVASLRLFRFRFSGLGGETPTPRPLAEEPLPSTADGAGGSAVATTGWNTWTAYPSGVAVATVFGEGFIPWSEVTGVSREWWGGWCLEHTSIVLRSPLVVPAALGPCLRSVMSERSGPT